MIHRIVFQNPDHQNCKQFLFAFEHFVKAIFSVIEASEAKSNQELMENSIVANAKMIGKYASFDRDTKKEVRKVLGMLADAIHNNSPFVKLLRSFGESKD